MRVLVTVCMVATKEGFGIWGFCGLRKRLVIYLYNEGHLQNRDGAWIYGGNPMGEIIDDEEINGVIRHLQGSTSTKFMDLIITNKRILIIRTRPAIKGALIGGAAGGAIGAVIGHSIDKKKVKEVPMNKNLGELLGSDPKNLSLPLESLKSVKLKKGLFSSDIWIIPQSGKKLHIGINSKKYYDEWKPILENAIPNKLVV